MVFMVVIGFYGLYYVKKESGTTGQRPVACSLHSAAFLWTPRIFPVTGGIFRHRSATGGKFCGF